MKTQERQHISNKYNTCTVVTSPVYTGSKVTLTFACYIFDNWRLKKPAEMAYQKINSWKR